MNNKGKGSGLALLLILIVALLIAFLVVRNMGSRGVGGDSSPQQDNYVQQAQDAVDALNQAQQQAGQTP